MQVVYQSINYKPEDVTGRYVLVQGKKGNYTFKVLETASSPETKCFKAKPGQGPTLREYVTTGEELPEELKERCIKTKTTEKWS